MITLGFKKTGIGTLISHTDLLRALNRTFGRAGIQVAYSSGFNRHMALYLTQPLPFGIADLDGYATMDAKGADLGELVEKFNSASPGYLEATFACESVNPRLSGKINLSKYRVVVENPPDNIEKILKGGYKIRKKTGETVDASPLVYGAETKDGFMECALAFGNINLRIDDLCSRLNEDFGLGIRLSGVTRIEQGIFEGGKYTPAKLYLENLCREKYYSE